MVVFRLSPLCPASLALCRPLHKWAIPRKTQALVDAYRARIALRDVQKDRADAVGLQGFRHRAHAAVGEAVAALRRMRKDVADCAHVVTPRDQVYAGDGH